MIVLLRITIASLVLLFAAIPAQAVNPDEMLKDPALEARARDISKGVRCLVCQNESVDDSNADLARDLRILIRERLTSGDSDEEVRAFLVSRYGEFVLLKPQFTARNLVLWLLPAMLLILAIAAFVLRAKNRGSRAMAPELSDTEKDRLKHLLDS